MCILLKNQLMSVYREQWALILVISSSFFFKKEQQYIVSLHAISYQFCRATRPISLEEWENEATLIQD